MAGRIPQTFVDELLDRVDIVELIDSRVKLKKSGKNYMACCPFHDEKTPSFSVNSEKQFYHCFGCGESGNAVGFLIAYEHRSFPEVIETLAQQQGMEIPRESRRDEEKFKQRQDLYSVLEKANAFYQEQLRSHGQASQAQDYLHDRGLTSHVAHGFGVGYAPTGWDNLLKFFAASDAVGNEGENTQLLSRSLLIQTGMLVEKEIQDERREEVKKEARVYDRFRHRIMFPIHDVRGRVVGFGGRVLNNEDKPKYLNSPETAVFHKGRELYGLYEALQANRHLERILVVEGYMDVVALAQYGITYATATLGTAASEHHLEKAFRHVPEIVFCFDGDEAGRRAARKALEVSLPALQDGRQVKFLFVPEGEDPDSLVRKLGKDAFLQRLEEASPLSEFLFQIAGEGLSLNTPEGRSLLITKVVPHLRKIPEGAYKGQLKQLLSSRGQADINDINNLLAAGGSIAGTRNDAKSQGQVRGQSQAPTETPVSAPAYSEGSDFEYSQLSPTVSESFSSSSMAKLSLWDEATSLLLRQPSLLELIDKEDIVSAEQDESAQERDKQRFSRCTRLLLQKPEASLNKILGLWQSLYGAEDGQYLYGLAGRESLLNTKEQAGQFADILRKLEGLKPQQRLEELIEKSKTHVLGIEEKQELSQLLSEKA